MGLSIEGEAKFRRTMLELEPGDIAGKHPQNWTAAWTRGTIAGPMFFLLSKILDVVLSPFTWALVLVALAVPWGRPHPRRWRRRRFFGAAGLAVLLVFAI